MVGTTLAHYRIIEQLGKGGMGEVYRAEDTRLKRHVALKVLPPELATDGTHLKRFRREAEALAALDHPSIVTVYSVEEAEGVQFLTMVLVEGTTLDQMIPGSGLEQQDFFRLAIPIADALAAAHDRGIVHRDLKPANIIVDEQGRPRILDFGLAKLRRSERRQEASHVSTRLTQPGIALGTMPYMSPEQLEGVSVDRRSDVFSLGIVLYEMSTGRRPFQGANPAALTSSILRDTPPPVSDERPSLPRQLGRIVQQCLEKDPGRRYQDARDVRNQLESLRRELATEEILLQRSRDRVTDHRWSARTGQPSRIPLPPWAGMAGALVMIGIFVSAAWLLNVWTGEGFATRSERVARPDLAGAAAGTPRFDSVAVLPFENLMNDPAQEYFVQGMHDAVITDLSKIGTLRVISRTSTMRYRDSDKSTPQIAEELDVDAVVEGSVLRAGGRVRITAQLVDARRDRHLWAEEYDRDLNDVLGLLSEVAQAIGNEVAGQLSPEVRSRMTAAGSIDPEAYDLYLRGRYWVNRFLGAEGFQKAVADFHQCLELEPEYAPAWAGLGFIHSVWAWAGVPGQLEKAREAGLKTLELDDRIGDGHMIMGCVELYAWNWDAAEESFRRALELNPNDSWTRVGYSMYLFAMGRIEASVEQSELARRIDPFSPLSVKAALGNLLRARRYAEAEEIARQASELFPEDPSFRGHYLYEALWGLKRYDESIAVRKSSLSEADSKDLQATYDRSGPDGMLNRRAEEALATAEANRTAPLSAMAAFSAAQALAAAGRVDEAFTWLERTYEQRFARLFSVRNPDFDSLRDDPRYRDLLERMGLPVEVEGAG